MKQPAIRLYLANIPDQPLLIAPPRRWLLSMVALQWLACWVISFISFHVIVFFCSAPAMAVLLYYHWMLGRHWRRYRYSLFLLHGATLIVWVACWATAPWLRQHLAEIWL